MFLFREISTGLGIRERERERALEKAILQTVYGWNYLWAWGNGYILDIILDMIQRNHPFVGKKDEWNLI